jgi:hypothetical protein
MSNLPVSRMLKKPASAKTVSREAYLARYEVLRLRTTRYERRTTGEEDGLFAHPAMTILLVLSMPQVSSIN